MWEMLGRWPCDWVYMIQVSEKSSSEEGRTHQLDSPNLESAVNATSSTRALQNFLRRQYPQLGSPHRALQAQQRHELRAYSAPAAY